MSQTSRRAARVDSNQKEIVDALNCIPGVTVQHGHDDLLVGYRNRTYWFEVKSPGNEKKLRPSQEKLFVKWTGHYQIVSTLEQILIAIGIAA